LQLGRAGVILAVALLAASCGTTGLSQLATIVSSYADPLGDADLTTAGTDYDVTRMVTRRIDNSPFGSYDTLQVEFTFAQTVVLPAGGTNPDAAGTQLAIYVGFDIDQNSATGGAALNCLPAAGSTGSGTWPGMEFFVAEDTGFQRLANGSFRVLDASLTTVGEATVSASGSMLTINVPLSAMGGDDGATHAFSIQATRAGGGLVWTDCTPNPAGSVITRERPTSPSPIERTR
jgi:hypothetical protein